MKLLEYFNAIAWGPFGCGLLLLGGVYLLIKLKGFYLLHPIKTVKALSSGGMLAMLSALGGSIGVGNIVGVGVALSLGGAGAVFWMWVCALITAVLKYAEIYLSVKYKESGKGGPMFYLGLCKATHLPEAFALLCVLSSFGIGCLVQSNAVSMCGAELSVSSKTLGAALAAVCLITFLGGGKGLQRICGVLVPIMSIVYIAACAVIIGTNVKLIPNTLSQILNSAFSIKSAVGGVGASLLVRGLREGMSKGIFSAESGMGSSAITYAFGDASDPAKQGVWGIVEVFIDTVVMCTLSAFVLLLSNKETVFSAFAESFGKAGGYFTLLSLFCFAYTSICCWNFYSTSCIRFLTKRNGALYIYNALFVICIYLGAVMDTHGVWLISDACNALMLYLNFYGIIRLSDKIRSPL